MAGSERPSIESTALPEPAAALPMEFLPTPSARPHATVTLVSPRSATYVRMGWSWADRHNATAAKSAESRMHSWYPILFSGQHFLRGGVRINICVLYFLLSL